MLPNICQPLSAEREANLRRWLPYPGNFTAAMVREIFAELDRARALLAEEEYARNLLAVIHRDGGHYTAEHGFQKSCKDAEAVVLGVRAELDTAQQEVYEQHELLGEIASALNVSELEDDDPIHRIRTRMAENSGLHERAREAEESRDKAQAVIAEWSDLLGWISAETCTRGYESGLPHVAMRCDKALAKYRQEKQG